jgi:ParB-like chromosome segregation protein Spo0J
MTDLPAIASFRLELLDNVVPDPDQPRKRFPEGPLAELAENIWHQGLNQPVTLTPNPANPAGNGPHLLFIGERRWKAFQINRERARRLFESGEELPEDHPAHRYDRWSRIPVLDEAPMPPAERLVRQVSENDAREGLTLYERALAYQRALGLSGLKAKEFAARFGIDAGTLSTFKGLVNAKGPTKLALELGLLNDAAAARLFQSLPKDQQEDLIQRAEEEETGLSRVVVQRALEAVEAEQRRIEKATNPTAPAPPASATSAGAPGAGEAESGSPGSPESNDRSPKSRGSEDSASPFSSSASGGSPSLPAAGSSGLIAPAIRVDTLNWLHNHLERLEAGEDEPLRLEAMEAFQKAVLHDSPYIAIREELGAA